MVVIKIKLAPNNFIWKVQPKLNDPYITNSKIIPVTHIVMIANKDKNVKTLKPLAKWGPGTLPSFLYIDWITALPIPPPPAINRDIRWRNLQMYIIIQKKYHNLIFMS